MRSADEAFDAPAELHAVADSNGVIGHSFVEALVLPIAKHAFLSFHVVDDLEDADYGEVGDDLNYFFV